MPVTELPDSAQAMRTTWWSTVMGWANRVDPDTGRPYSVTDVSAAASALHNERPDVYPVYSPPGVSALYSRALQVIRSPGIIAAADPAGPIPDAAIASPPWYRPAAEVSAMPVWQARTEITYTNPEGVQLSETITVAIPQQLPSSVASLQAQVELRVTDFLTAPPGTGTPRRGSLISVDSITLMAV